MKVREVEEEERVRGREEGKNGWKTKVRKAETVEMFQPLFYRLLFVFSHQYTNGVLTCPDLKRLGSGCSKDLHCVGKTFSFYLKILGTSEFAFKTRNRA